MEAKSQEPAHKQEQDLEKLFKEAKQYMALNPSSGWFTSFYRKDDTIGYIISKEWLRKWKKYVNYTAVKRNEIVKESRFPHPGRIDNETLLLPTKEYFTTGEPNDILDTALKPDTKERYHYSIKPKAAWDFLYANYGGTPIIRKIIKNTSQTYFDVNFQKIELCVIPKNENQIKEMKPPLPLFIHKTSSIIELKERAVKVLNKPEIDMKLNQQNFRLWKVELPSYKELMEYLCKIDFASLTFTDETDAEEGSKGIDFPGYCLEYFRNKPTYNAINKNSNIILVEAASLDGKFIFRKMKKVKLGNCTYCQSEKPLPNICHCKEAFYCGIKCQTRDQEEHFQSCSYQEEIKYKLINRTQISRMGLVGLHNLGNTCFMNSSIQCLSHSFQLTDYFLRNYYEKDINIVNSICIRGRLASAYAKLMKQLWYDSNAVIHPTSIKACMGNLNDIYKGYQQHDAFDLISHILDRLHEELNRVREAHSVELKVYTESNLSEGSAERWNAFLIKNQSIIVDLFYGQLLNRVRCSKCNCQSFQFDQFSSLTLPLPNNFQHEVAFEYIPFDITKKTIFCKLKQTSNITVEQFRKVASVLLKVDIFSFIIVCIDKTTNEAERIVGHKFIAKEIFNYYMRRNDKICLIQINPKIWNGNVNHGFFEIQSKQLIKFYDLESEFELKERKRHSTDEIILKKTKAIFTGVEEQTDFNNGLDIAVIKILTHFKIYEKQYMAISGTIKKTDAIAPRYIHLLKSASLQQLHFDIFELFRPLFYNFIEANGADIKCTLSEYKEMSTEQAMNIIKDLLSQDKYSSFYTDSEFPIGALYIVRVHFQLGHANTTQNKCFYCEKTDCKGCEIKMNPSITIDNFMSKRVLNDLHKYGNNCLLYKKKGFTKGLDFEIEVQLHDKLLDEILNYKISSLSEVIPYENANLSNIAPIFTHATLNQCLDLYTKEEIMPQDDTWFCPKCGDHIRSWKKIQLLRGPRILIIHLNRFKPNRDNGKNNDFVECPLKQDFSKFIKFPEEDPTTYELYAVINHTGSKGYGHYTSTCFNFNKGCWVVFDDDKIYELSKGSPVTNEAYILFYKREDVPFEILDYTLYKETSELDYKKQLQSKSSIVANFGLQVTLEKTPTNFERKLTSLSQYDTTIHDKTK